MNLAIMQPTYLPWIGYFDLIDRVDNFILLDDAQFSKQSWQQRNRLKTSKGLEWVTLPVKSRGRLGQSINEVELSNAIVCRKHLKMIENNYSKTPFFPLYRDSIRELYQLAENHCRLSPLLTDLIHFIADSLSITTPITLSSSMGLKSEHRSLRIIEICKRFGCNNYISTAGALTYLIDDYQYFDNESFNIWICEYKHPVYTQRYGPFYPFASAVDLLFNEGLESRNIMMSGRLDLTRIEDLDLSHL
jgi:hypothetical protein